MKKNITPTIQEAEALEKTADEMKTGSLNSAGPFYEPEDVAKKYEDAADLYGKAGDTVKAQELYRRAKIYGYTLSPGDTKRVEDKIRNLRISKAHSLGFGGALEKRAYAIISIISLAGALFFTSLNLNGYATGSLANDTSLLGIALFITGLIFAFAFLRKKGRF